MEQLVHSDYYQGFGIEIFQTPDTDLWDVAYYYCIFDDDGAERLDGSEYEPKDFLHRLFEDAFFGAKYQIERFWLYGQNWYPSDEEVRAMCLAQDQAQGYRQ